MAITKPVTKTLISTTAWGIPITDAVNANTDDVASLKAWRAAFGSASLAGAGGTFGNNQQIAAITIPANALARVAILHYHVFCHSIIDTGNIHLWANNVPILTAPIQPSASLTQTVALTRVEFPLAANLAYFIQGVAAGSAAFRVSTYTDPNFNLIQWNARPL